MQTVQPPGGMSRERFDARQRLYQQMLEEADPKKRQQTFDELRRIADDPAAARDFLIRSSMIWSVRRAAEIT